MANDAKTDITAEELAKRYQNAVQDEVGLLARIDDVKDVIFKYSELGTMYFSLDAENDPEYMMLVFPSFADLNTLGVTREKLLIAINAVNTQNKAVKLSIRRDKIETTCDVMASIECFLAGVNQAPTEELLRATIRRNLSALKAGVQNLIQELGATKPPPAKVTDTI
jgi:hypothetical protein